MSDLRIVVHDLPAPQGSKRHVGGGVMVESSKRVKPWREAVKQAALDALLSVSHLDDGVLYDEPVRITATFTMPRPKGHYRTGRNAHLLRDLAPIAPGGTPDLDKLLRSTFDALTAAGVWRDDSLVCSIGSFKTFPDGRFRHVDALPHPGAVIQVAGIAEYFTRGVA